MVSRRVFEILSIASLLIGCAGSGAVQDARLAHADGDQLSIRVRNQSDKSMSSILVVSRDGTKREFGPLLPGETSGWSVVSAICEVPWVQVQFDGLSVEDRARCPHRLGTLRKGSLELEVDLASTTDQVQPSLRVRVVELQSVSRIGPSSLWVDGPGGATSRRVLDRQVPRRFGGADSSRRSAVLATQ